MNNSITILKPENGIGDNDLSAPNASTEFELQVIKFNVTDSAIAEMRNNYMALRIDGYEDKNGYKVVYNARQIVKNKRILVGKTSKELQNPYKEKIEAIKTEEKRILELLAPIENYLEQQEDDYNNQIERIKKEASEKEHHRIQERIDKLSNFGFRVDYSDIKSMTDISFNELLKQAETKYNEDLKAKEEAERLQKEEAERLLAQKRELELQRHEQARQQKQLEMEQQILAAEKQAIENQKKKDAEEKEQIEREKLAVIEAKKKEEKEKKRIAKLKPDNEKLKEFADSLGDIVYPECKDDDADLIVRDARVRIQSIQTAIMKRVENFSELITKYQTSN